MELTGFGCIQLIFSCLKGYIAIYETNCFAERSEPLPAEQSQRFRELEEQVEMAMQGLASSLDEGPPIKEEPQFDSADSSCSMDHPNRVASEEEGIKKRNVDIPKFTL